MSNILSIYIILLVLFSIVGYSALIYFTRSATNTGEDHPHSVDGITELNQPLPAWWLWLFVLTIIFGLFYLCLYPGLGKNKGLLEWTSHKACEALSKKENDIYNPIYASFSKYSVDELSSNLKALKIGKSLFINNCSLCHGLDAKGGNGFPNLTNNKWLYGGSPEEIKMTITNGRRGKMPPYISIIGSEEEIESTALYVISLSDSDVSPVLTSKGKIKFNTICSACHGLNAKGNKFIGAPDLTDPQWVYGNGIENIKNSIKFGRNGVMPSHKDVLTKEQIHILTAYIYSLNKI